MSNHYSYNILLVGDSRVRDLDLKLNMTPLNLHFTVISLSGADLNTITLKTLTQLSYPNSYQLILIVAGINSMTKLLYNPSRHAVPRHGSAEVLIENTLAAMRVAIGKIKAITPMPVVLATVPGMDFAVYSPEYYDLLLPLQSSFDEAVTEINLRIRGINRLNNLSTLNLAYPVHRCKGKHGKYRTQYTLLHDGLHPSEYLKDRWVVAIIKYCTSILPGVYHR